MTCIFQFSQNASRKYSPITCALESRATSYVPSICRQNHKQSSGMDSSTCRRTIWNCTSLIKSAAVESKDMLSPPGFRERVTCMHAAQVHTCCACHQSQQNVTLGTQGNTRIVTSHVVCCLELPSHSRRGEAGCVCFLTTQLSAVWFRSIGSSPKSPIKRIGRPPEIRGVDLFEKNVSCRTLHEKRT